MRIRIGLLLAALVTAVSLAYAQQGTLEIAVDQSPVGLDPDIVTAFSSFAVVDQIYEGLLEVNSKLQLEPALATSWTVSPDGLSYTFELRQGVKFHNGRAMTSADVVYSFDRIMDPNTGSPQASRFSEVSKIEATGPYEVRFTLKEPFAPFLANLANLYVVPKEVVEANGNLQKVAVGTGPFELEKVVPDTYVLLKANPDYYRPGEPKVAELKFNVVPEASTRAAGLRTGTYQLLPTVDPVTAQTLKNAGGVKVMGTQDLAYSLLGLNVSRKPFDDPRVHQAINYAVNRSDIVQAVYLGNAVAGGPVSPALKDWAVPVSQFACYQPSVAKAKQLLADAGYPDGFKTTIITFGTIKEVADTAQVLQAQLAQVGIDAKVDVEEFGKFVQDWKNSNFDMFVSLNGGATDPDGYLYRTFHTGGSTNVFKFSDPSVDTLLEQGRTTADQTKRIAIYDNLQKQLACTGPVVHIAYGTLFTAVRDNVQGFQQMPTRSLQYLRETALP